MKCLIHRQTANRYIWMNCVVTVICGHIRPTISLYCGGNTAYCVKLCGEDLNQSVWENVSIIIILLRKWCHNNKHFSEFAPHHGGKTAGVDMAWRNYVTITLVPDDQHLHHSSSSCTGSRFDNGLITSWPSWPQDPPHFHAGLPQPPVPELHRYTPLHDATCCQTSCQSVWQLVGCLYTRHDRLSIQLDKRLDNMLYRVYKHPTGCQTGCTTGCRTGLTTGWMFVYTMQPVVHFTLLLRHKSANRPPEPTSPTALFAAPLQPFGIH